MNREELRQCLLDSISDVAPEVTFEALDPDKGLREQLDLDSMDFLNVVIGLHEKLGIDIPERDYPQLFTLRGAIDYLAARTAGR